jgi:pantoate--beta-alanine ligase
MSSRNQLLEKQNRLAAPLIYQCLQEVQEKINTADIDELQKYVAKTINSNPFLKLEYFEIVDSTSLSPIHKITSEKKANACIAVFAGKVRLIDNVEIIL